MDPAALMPAKAHFFFNGSFLLYDLNPETIEISGFFCFNGSFLLPNITEEEATGEEEERLWEENLLSVHGWRTTK